MYILSLSYSYIDFVLKFAKKVQWETDPHFILRSILGKELRALFCIFDSKKKCSECSINQNCVYSKFFESHISKDQAALAGRNRASHPFVPSVKKGNDRVTYSIIFIGKAVDHINSVYLALKQAGKRGVFKDRILFDVLDVKSDYKSIIVNNKVEPLFEEKVWNSDSESIFQQRRIKIKFETPCRLKIRGKYSSEPEIKDVLLALYRRLSVLEQFYGTGNMPEYIADGHDYEILDRSLYWVDQVYYSGRQKKAIKLGGFMGEMIISGTFTELEISL